MPSKQSRIINLIHMPTSQPTVKGVQKPFRIISQTIQIKSIPRTNRHLLRISKIQKYILLKKTIHFKIAGDIARAMSISSLLFSFLR